MMDNPSKGKERILRDNSEDPAHNEETSGSTLEAVSFNQRNSNNWRGNGSTEETSYH
jgi:hypothetical protein